MEKFKQIEKIKEIYSKGENIIKYLRGLDNSKQNSVEDIVISYDVQAGSYIRLLNHEFKSKYCNLLAQIIDGYQPCSSIMEAGIGEATTLGYLLKHLTKQPANILGFDISWSRLKFAQNFLREFNPNSNDISLFVANLFEIPLLDNSVDIVYTSHAIEPNGGKEKEAIQELYRVTGKYLILLEPSFEFANDAAKIRMEEHGFVKNLYATSVELGYKIIEHRLFELSANPLNPTGLIVIERSNSVNPPDLKCPLSKTNLIKYNDSLLFSKDSLLSYPVIDQIPCLLKENSILTTHLLTDYEEYKLVNKIDFSID